MNLVREEKLDRQIKKEFEYDFEIKKEGLYAIEISARAKSWLQNTLKLISFLKDDDLAVKIDNKEFPKLSGKKGLFDSEAAWNGNELKNLRQINVFLAYFSVGKHSLKFIADQFPYLETIKVYQADNEKNVVFEPVKNYQIESGNRRPWLNLILIGFALEGLKIQASANQRQGDDDDLQLKINGERQINNTLKSHKYGPPTKEYTDSVWHIYKNGIKKEKNNIIQLWMIALILLFSTFLLWGHKINETSKLKAMVIDSFDPRQQLQIQDIEIKSHKDDTSLFLAVAEWEKDWWEELKIGILKDGAIKWLEIENPPHEQSILSARFIDLKGFYYPILEVYGKTHTGNGALYLYKAHNDRLLPIFETTAVDFYNENVWRSENYQKYNYGACGQIYEGGKLSVAYPDINIDGISDITLRGKVNIICEKEIAVSNIFEDREVKVSDVPVSKVYLWDKNNRVFAESI